MNFWRLIEQIRGDCRIAISFCTILPLGQRFAVNNGDVASASWALPIGGLLVGFTGAASYSLACNIGLPVSAAAMLALVATILITGAIHEDGLADTADGLGGGRTRQRKLEIMRDSRIGTFGACALVASLVLRWSALVTLADPRLVSLSLLIAHGAARGGLPPFMCLVPPARTDGLSARSGQPSKLSALIACGLGIACLLLGFGPGKTAIAFSLLLLAGVALAWLVVTQIAWTNWRCAWRL